MLRLKRLFLPKKPILTFRYQFRLKAQKVLAKNYDFLQYIGGGSFADVLAFWSRKDLTTVCAKIMHPLITSKYEIELWTKLKHPNIVPVLKLIQKPEVDIFLIPHYPRTLMDILQEDNFLDKEGSFEMTLHFAENVCSGLDYMHNKKVCHLDLKANNIMISEQNEAVIADFSTIAFTDTPTDWYGIPNYCSPPEAFPLKVDGPKPKVDGRAFDIWSAGMIIFCCFTARSTKLVYRSLTVSQPANWWNAIYPLIFKCLQFDFLQSLMSVSFPSDDTNGEQSTCVLNIIKGVLRYNPENRPSASRILNHIICTGRGDLLEPDKMWSEDGKEVQNQVIRGKLHIIMRTAAERIKILRGRGKKDDTERVHGSGRARMRLLEKTRCRTLFQYWFREKWEAFRCWCRGERGYEQNSEFELFFL